MNIGPEQILSLVFVGLLAGASGGLLGIGGSTVAVPGMVIVLGEQLQHLYQAAAMIVNLFVVAPATWQYRQAGTIQPRVVRWTAPSAVIGTMAGTLASDLPVFRDAGQGYLQVLFALFLFYALLYNLFRLRNNKRLPPLDADALRRLSPLRMVGIVGLPSGLIGGLLGIGGGLIALPMQQIFLRIPLPNAVANSAVTILFSSVVGAVVKNASLGHHNYDWRDACALAGLLIPPAMLASWYMADKMTKLPVRVIRIAFSILLLYGGIRLLRAGLSHTHPMPPTTEPRT